MNGNDRKLYDMGEFMYLKDILIRDLQQLLYINNELGVKDIIKCYFKYPCYKLIVYLRLTKYLKDKKKLILLFGICRLKYRKLSIKLGIQIPYDTEIGKGFSIHHYSCIVIHGKSKIGENFNIRQGVTIGDVNKRVPVIGNNVYVGAGAKIIGDIVIGNNVIIGANSVVTKNISDNCIVAGIPAKVIRKIEV